MRKRLIYSLSLLFLLFSLGAGITMLYTYRITQDLESVITLHRIEIIRQSFVINIQTVQSNLYATGTIFGKELDTIVDNVSAMDASVKNCLSCHHEQEMTDRLVKVNEMVEQYKEALKIANENVVTANDRIKKATEDIQVVAEERNEMAKKYNKMATDFNELATKWNTQQQELQKLATNTPAPPQPKK